MKKLLILFILAIITGFQLYAQLGPGMGIGGWARYVFSPIGGTGTIGESFDKDNLFVSAQSHASSFFPQKGKIGLAAWGNSDYVGFNFDFAYQNAMLEVGDQAKIWIRPLDMLMLHAGKIQGNALRGKIPGGQLVTMEEEDDIFFRFYPQYGMLVDFTPIENLYIGASVDGGSRVFETAFNVYDWESTSLTSGYQIGAGYMFGFGHLRAQFISLNTDNINSSLYRSGKPLQIAFAYTDIYNLIIELSVKYPLRALTSSHASGTIAAQYLYEQFSFMGRFTYMAFPEMSGNNYRIRAGSVIKYSINFPLFLGLELSYFSDNPLTATIDDMIQIAPYLGFRYSRGEFRIGFYWQQGFKDDKAAYVFEFPLLFEAKFF